METGALNWTDDILDKIVLESDLLHRTVWRTGNDYKSRRADHDRNCVYDLGAVNQGLGTCWVGAMSPKDAHNVMGLPNNVFVHDLLPLGYPDEDPRPRPRKDPKKISFWGKYID
jgi:hypothetical protein